ncbi:MAG TPA: hypothetical protein VMZ28_19740, partial [Kofleriaceae bacterium]|nr:hypothetical protein [Kofleriaceae bacterium]
MRALLALAAVAVVFPAGCGGVRPCKGDTMLVTLTLEGVAASADAVEVDALVDGGGDHLTGRFPFAIADRTGTVEIQFPGGYPIGKNVTVRVTALKGAGKLAQERAVIAATPGCTAAAISVGAGDGGGGCDPTADTRCSTDRMSLETCRPDGSGFDATPCAFGCAGTTPHCLRLEPSGALDPADYLMATTPTVIAADASFDTDTGAITGGFSRDAGPGLMNAVYYRSVPQPGSTVRIGAFAFGGLSVNPGVTLTFVGRSPVALLSSGNAMIGGTLDLQGNCVTPAAGGATGGKPDVNNGDGLGTRPGRSGIGVLNAASGGGGAGHGDNGGNGGNGTGATGGAGGALYGDLTSEPIILNGGPGGGAGGGGLTGGNGGHGGGALQVSANGPVVVAGVINAGGCGGRAGASQTGGGGGGSGGVILIEGSTVQLATGTVLAANGGAGGGGDTGNPGGNGNPTAIAALGGIGRVNGTAG